jgi:hypothetical protein
MVDELCARWEVGLDRRHRRFRRGRGRPEGVAINLRGDPERLVWSRQQITGSRGCRWNLARAGRQHDLAEELLGRSDRACPVASGRLFGGRDAHRDAPRHHRHRSHERNDRPCRHHRQTTLGRRLASRETAALPRHFSRRVPSTTDQSPSRNARTGSGGLYRPGLVPIGAVRAIACSLRAGSAAEVGCRRGASRVLFRHPPPEPGGSLSAHRALR